MAIKPERYTDGVKRATIRVEFVIDRSFALGALAQEFWSEADRPTKLTRALVEKAVRSHIQSFGYSEQDVDDEDTWDWADAEVTRLFPDWEN